MNRFKITVRGLGVELRGYMDELTDEDAPSLIDFSEAMKPLGLVIASPAGRDYNPFQISEPDNPPTIEMSRELIAHWQETMSAEEYVEHLATIHHTQAVVIRGERGRAERAEAELAARELHHFETEQENEWLKTEPRCDFDCDVCREGSDE